MTYLRFFLTNPLLDGNVTVNASPNKPLNNDILAARTSGLRAQLLLMELGLMFWVLALSTFVTVLILLRLHLTSATTTTTSHTDFTRTDLTHVYDYTPYPGTCSRTTIHVRTPRMSPMHKPVSADNPDDELFTIDITHCPTNNARNATRTATFVAERRHLRTQNGLGAAAPEIHTDIDATEAAKIAETKKNV
jgi:hypothetical protein